MKKLAILIFLMLSINNTFCQELGIRIGFTTATATGNNDAYHFNFIESFSPKPKIGLLYLLKFADVMTLKPELSARLYTIRQKININNNESAMIEQTHYIGSLDLNFDTELSRSWSMIFGIGLDYLVFQQYDIEINNVVETYNQDFNNVLGDVRFDPFANIGFCYQLNKGMLIDLEYRHLLDNWGTGSPTNTNQLLSSSNGSVKIHMINVSLTILV